MLSASTRRSAPQFDATRGHPVSDCSHTPRPSPHLTLGVPDARWRQHSAVIRIAKPLTAFQVASAARIVRRREAVLAYHQHPPRPREALDARPTPRRVLRSRSALGRPSVWPISTFSVVSLTINWFVSTARPSDRGWTFALAGASFAVPFTTIAFYKHSVWLSFMFFVLTIPVIGTILSLRRRRRPYQGPPMLNTGLFFAMWMAGSTLGAFIFIGPGLPWR